MRSIKCVLGFGVLCATLAVAGCANPPGAQECASGIVCPAGMQCAAAQPVCISNNCGNGLVDQGEQCDDGNIIDGDGCSHLCTQETCGNRNIDPGEECDDGNRENGDGCSASCRKEECGNGVLDPGEQCDDGNNTNGDGCSAACKREFCGDSILNNGEVCDRTLTPATCNIDCTISRCGDGKLNASADPPEQCDDGNSSSGDGCSSTCQFERCGNGIVDPGEDCDGVAGLQPCSAICHQEICGNGILDRDPAHGINEQCDDGNTNDGDGCSASCKREFCGDNIVNNSEACDRALTPATCNIDCTLSRCGDGKLNTSAVPPEQCDDGNATNGDGCSPTCQFERCGNGIVDPGEDCDGVVGLQPCSASCHQEICGNGILDRDLAQGINEQCDDGNILNGDGCSASCKREFCGDGVVNNGEACDRALTPATCNIDCTLSRCGDGKLNTSAVPPEQCDDGNATNGDGCSPTCQFERCGNGIVDPGEDCDGVVGLQPCSASCHQEICGNGILDRDLAQGINEQCDDGNILNGDGCSASCKREFCGDGVVNDGEACDRALTPATCNIDCTVSACGDGKLNASAVPPEQCDDGNHANGDGCSSTCGFEHCGNGIVDPGEDCDGVVGLQPCSASCHQEICGNGILDRDLAQGINEQCDDGNILNGDGCSASCKREFCGDGIVNDGEACDRALTPATCNIDCTVSACGDGKLNASAVPPEQCDDGNHANSDGCSSMCQFEHCGNGILDPGEDCDGAAGPQPCSASCHREICGNGILDQDPAHGINEQCDDGNTTNGDGCSSSCHFETCGNGIKDQGEDCDDGVNNGTLISTCSTTCHFIACGNGVLEQGEDCDDGNQVTERCLYGATSCTVCDATCHSVVGATSLCGDGFVDAAAGEVCDDGNTSCGACSSNCTAQTSAPATGSLVVPAGNHFQTGDTFVLSDGVTMAIFEFTVKATPVPALDVITITVNTAATSDVIAADIAAAINSSPLRITASVGAPDVSTTVTLVHRDPTSNGNQPIAKSFADSSFTVSGMAGGQGGNCAADQVCKLGIDCASQVCSATTGRCL